MGGCIAALLDRAGHEVEVAARSSLPAIAADGLRLTGAFGTHVAGVQAGATLERRPDLAILATKTVDTHAALEANRAALLDVPLLVVQNGLAGHTKAAAVLGHSQVAGGVVTWAANALEPGSVRVTATGETLVGGASADAFAGLLSPGIPALSVVRNIEGAQWTKLVINMLNAVPAIVGQSVQECVADDALRRVMAASMREAACVGAATGARFERIAAMTPTVVRAVRGPRWIAERVLRRMAARFGSVPNLGSTQQSILRGQRTEVDELNGAVVEAAAASGQSAPINAALTALVHEVERGGFLPPARLAGLG